MTSGSTRWLPPVVTPWQWEIDHALNTASASDMGTGVTTYTGQPAPDPTMYDIDGFDTPAATVAALHATGRHVVCYIETGAVESYRPDAGQFPAADLGDTMPGYPQERYIDIRDIAGLRPVMDARLQMCKSKGFDAVEPDIDDSYASTTGFPLTVTDQVNYDQAIAADAHAIGLSIALKNGDTPSFALAMLPSVDFAIDEQCFQYSSCDAFTPFVATGKAVFEVEYSTETSNFCPQANAMDFNAEKQNVALNGGRHPCR